MKHFELPKFSRILLTTFVIAILSPVSVTAANVTWVELHGTVFDEKSAAYNATLQWDAQNFTGFWYNPVGGKSSETLSIDKNGSNLTGAGRTIEAQNLTYRTSRTDQAYTVFREKGLKVTNGLEYNSTTKTFTINTTGSYYARLGWLGELYIPVNGKANKLTRIVKDQAKSEKKTMTIQETWDLGEGFSLTANAIDAKATPRQAHLTLSKDGTKLEDKVVTEGEVYTYIQDLAGEKDVPVFVTYAESIFAGASGDMVQLRYTWLISQKVTEIKNGNVFGIFEVNEVNDDYLLLKNAASINLAQNAVIDLAGGIKFKVADSSTALRFYPIIEKTLPGKYEVRGGVYDQSKYTNLKWDAQRFPGFWYNLVSGKTSETLAINQNASNLTNANRVIEAENLTYMTSRTSQNYSLFTVKGMKVEKGLDYNSTAKTFTNAPSGGYYARLGWFGTLYVAMNGKANKLTRLIKEQAKSDKQTLTIGETWDLGEGFSLTANSIDAKASPRQTHLIFSKDGIKLDDKIIMEGQAYTYIQTLNGESDVPVFVTYVESIFAGATSDMVQLRYTWLISRNVIEVRNGDDFGVFAVKEATEDYLLLQNPTSINLDQNAVIDLGGDMKIKVADSSTALRFYPYVEYNVQATSQAELRPSNSSIAAANTTTNVTSSNTTSSNTTSSNITAMTEPTGDVTEQAPAAAPPAATTRVTKKPKDTAGFEAILFAVAGLFAVAFRAMRKRG